MSKYPPFCRICREDKGKLIKPCRCNGSLKHIHEECLKIWLRSIPRHMDQAGCEICNSKYSMEYVLKHKCIPQQMFREGLSNCLFIPLLSIVITILSVITYLLIHKIQRGFTNAAQEIYAVFLVIACALSILFLVMLILFTLKETCFAKTLDNWTIFNRSFHEKKEESLQDYEIRISSDHKETNGAEINMDIDDQTTLSRPNAPRSQPVGNLMGNN